MPVPQPAYFAFQGGGALGMAHLGAWEVLSRRFSPAGVVGTSAGSIIAALAAARMEPATAIDLFRALDWPAFVNSQGIWRWVQRRDAWSDGTRFYEWLLAQIGSRFPNVQPKDITFKYLTDTTGVYLAVVAADLNEPTGSPVIFSSERDAVTTVAFAVRCSISIPGVFTTVRIGDRQELVDGGVLLNFPVAHVLSRAAAQGLPLVGVRFNQPLAYLDYPNLLDTLRRTLSIASAAGSNLPDSVAAYPDYIDVEIDVAGIDSLNFKLTERDKQDLLRRGSWAATNALLNYDNRLLRRTQPAPVPQAATSAPPQERPLPAGGSSAVEVSRAGAPAVPGADVTREEHFSLNQQQIRELADLVLGCRSVREPGTRQTIMSMLPQDIQTAVVQSGRPDSDVLNLLQTCAQFAGGLRTFLDAVRFFERTSLSMEKIERYLASLP